MGWAHSVEKQAGTTNSAQQGPIVMCYELALNWWVRRWFYGFSIFRP